MAHPTLHEALQAQHEASMVQQAETIQRWRIPHERLAEAEIHVRLALSERGLGRISEQTKYRVFSILSFAIPRDAALDDESVPLPELESESAVEAAYFEQLRRQSCAECGDGLCPVEAPIVRHPES